MVCPKCGSERIKKNGAIHNKKQKYHCNTCITEFVENPQNIIIDEFMRNLVVPKW